MINLSTLLVQDFLRENSFKDLEEKHGVKYSIDRYKVSLNYCQINSDESDPLAKQCRGLILYNVDGKTINPKKPLKNSGVLCYGMDRFFNLGQPSADDIDWESAIIEEKLDGTLIMAYFDWIDNEWHVATRSVPEANQPIDGYTNYTFRTLFEKSVYPNLDKFLWSLSKYYTYCFELVTPLNQMVVRHNDYKFYHLATRSNETFEEVADYGFNNKPRTYNLSSLSDIVKYVNEQPPTEHEGVVVKDKNFKRIKIKSAAYVAAHKSRDVATASKRNVVQLIFDEQLDDVIAVMPPDIADMLREDQEKVRAWLHFMSDAYLKLYTENNKEFALAVQKAAKEDGRVWAPVLFGIKRGHAKTPTEFIQKQKKNNSYKKTLCDAIIKASGIK